MAAKKSSKPLSQEVYLILYEEDGELLVTGIYDDKETAEYDLEEGGKFVRLNITVPQQLFAPAPVINAEVSLPAKAIPASEGIGFDCTFDVDFGEEDD